MKRFLLILCLVLFLIPTSYSEKETEDLDTKKDDLEIPEVIIQGEEEEQDEKKQEEDISDIEIEIDDEIEKEISEIKKIEDEEEGNFQGKKSEENYLSIGAGSKSKLDLKGYIKRDLDFFDFRLGGFYNNVDLLCDGDSMTSVSELMGNLDYKFSEHSKLHVSVKTNFKSQEIPDLDNLMETSTLVGVRVIFEQDFLLDTFESTSKTTINEKLFAVEWPDELFLPTDTDLDRKFELNSIDIKENVGIKFSDSEESNIEIGYRGAGEYNVTEFGFYYQKKNPSVNIKSGLNFNQFKTEDAHSLVFPYIKGEIKFNPKLFLEFNYKPYVELKGSDFYFNADYTYFFEELYPVEHVMLAEIGLKNLGYVNLKGFPNKVFYMLYYGFFTDKVRSFYYPVYDFQRDFQGYLNAPALFYGFNVKNSYVFSDDLSIALNLTYRFKDNLHEQENLPYAVERFYSDVFGVPTAELEGLVKYQISKKLYSELKIQYIGDRKYLKRIKTGLPGEEEDDYVFSYANGDLSLKYDINRLFSTYFQIENITNTHFNLDSNHQNSGIKFILGMNLLF